MRTTLLSSGSTFAHLLGRGKADKAEDKKAETVDSGPLVETIEDADRVDDEMDPKKKKKTGDDDKNDDPDNILDETEDKDEEQDDSRLPGEKDDDNDRKDAKASAARARERARCARIFGTAAAGRRPDVAAHLAFGTDMSASAVIGTLRAVVAGERVVAAAPAPAPQAGSDLRQRMRQEPRYDLGTESEKPKPSGPDAFAAKMKLADEKRRGLA